RRDALLPASARPVARAARAALRRDSPADAAGRESSGTRATRPTLPRQAAAAVLAGNGQLRRLRRPRLGGASGARLGWCPHGACDLSLGSPRRRRTRWPVRRAGVVPVGWLCLSSAHAQHGQPALPVGDGRPGLGPRGADLCPCLAAALVAAGRGCLWTRT